MTRNFAGPLPGSPCTLGKSGTPFYHDEKTESLSKVSSEILHLISRV